MEAGVPELGIVLREDAGRQVVTDDSREIALSKLAERIHSEIPQATDLMEDMRG